MTLTKHEKKHEREAMILGLIGLFFFALGFIVFPEPATFTGGLQINVYVVIGFFFFILTFIKPIYGRIEKFK